MNKKHLKTNSYIECNIKFILLSAMIFLIIFRLPCIGSAATTDIEDKGLKISMGEFLSTAFKDTSLSSQNERIDFLKQNPGGISFIEDPEFRVTIDQFEADQQKYALRLKPRGWDEIKQEKEVHSAMLQAGRVQMKSLVHRALKSRYISVVDFFYFFEMTSLHKELKLIFEDWERVLKERADTPDFDAGELADIENQRIALQMDIMDMKHQHDAAVEEIRVQSGYGKKVSLDTDHPISINLLSDKILSIHRDEDCENIYLNHAKAQTLKAEARYRLEAAENNRIISFIETEYNAADEDDFDKAFSIEFGISIPIGSGSRENIIQRKLESMKFKSEQESLEREITHTIPGIQQKLRNLIEQYKAVQHKKENGFSSAAFERLLQMEGTDPVSLLKLRKSMIKTDILLAKLSHTILTNYIDLLDITGKLSEKPLINHLLSDYEEVIGR